MKKRHIFLYLLVIVFGVAITFAYVNYDYVESFYFSYKYSKQELEQMMTDNDAVLKQDLETYLGHPIREITDEEIKQIEDGVLTKEEVIEKIVREELDKTGETSENVKNVNYYITELYNLKNEYIGILDAMVISAVNDYKALDKSQQTRSKQLEIGANYAKKATQLEAECDAKVAAIVSNIENLLRAEGKSTDIVNTINEAYKTEKTLKRAYYLNMFK